MKKISYWASAHKWTARIVLTLSFLLLNFLGFETGILLNRSGVTVQSVVVFIFFLIFLTGVIIYPSQKNKKVRSGPFTFYARQKSCDFLLAASTWAMAVCLGNNPDALFMFDLSASSSVSSTYSFPADSTNNSYKSIKDFSTSMKDVNGKTLKWKERKKLLKEQLKAIKKDNTLSPGTKTLLTILSILVAVGLLVLIVGLSCNLSCDGSGAAAVLVGIGGIALIVFLLVIVMRAIYGKKIKKIKVPESPATTN
ncbi:MAG TPA: hypothetical protein VG676_16735 [Chitinophagaceae bacterium]|jgi:p-aminobenzoyl-glutamate transporter AbgT|nr:hypothetical protein [Chitinophagaceae bacterium]